MGPLAVAEDCSGPSGSNIDKALALKMARDKLNDILQLI